MSKINEEWRQLNNKYKCPECGKEYSKQGIGYHIWSNHGEGKNHKPTLGKSPWNKGLTEETDERIKIINQKCSNKMKSKITNGEYFLSKNSNCHKGQYKSYWCDSSWELAFVIYNLEHNIKFQRNLKGFEYEFNKKKYHYFPDFIMEDGTYVEIKGYENEQTLQKYKFFPCTLKILKYKELKDIIKYVKNKYGKDFIKLYEPS